MKCLAIIPAKSKSVRIPNKNFHLIGPNPRKPMWWYTVKAAAKSDLFDKIVISTDSREFLEEGGYYYQIIEEGYPVNMYHRDEKLCKDTTRVAEVCIDVLSEFMEDNHDFFCLLLPTNPLRTEEDIRTGFNFLSQIPSPDFVMSVSKYPFNANYALECRDGTLKSAFAQEEYFDVPRQNLSETYYADGAVCWARVSAFLGHADKKISPVNGNTIFFRIPPERAMDVDEPLDLVLVEALMERREKL